MPRSQWGRGQRQRCCPQLHQVQCHEDQPLRTPLPASSLQSPPPEGHAMAVRGQQRLLSMNTVRTASVVDTREPPPLCNEVIRCAHLHPLLDQAARAKHAPSRNAGIPDIMTQIGREIAELLQRAFTSHRRGAACGNGAVRHVEGAPGGWSTGRTGRRRPDPGWPSCTPPRRTPRARSSAASRRTLAPGTRSAPHRAPAHPPLGARSSPAASNAMPPWKQVAAHCLRGRGPHILCNI